MKAAFLTHTGNPDVIVIGEQPTPAPKTGEVLIRVRVAAVNPMDTYIRKGLVPAPAFPYIIGCDFAGTVEALGEGVENFAVGQRVWGTNQGMVGRQGTFAELIAVHTDWVYPSPEKASDEALAACSLVGITAHLGLFQFGDLQPDDTVFINGGTGGVGAMAVQLAQAHGARVITTVGNDGKAALATKLGADVVINYKTDDLAARIREATDGAGVALWYETHREQDLDRIIPLMAKRGRIIVMAGRASRPILPVGPFYVNCLSLHGFAMFNCSALEQSICAEEIMEYLEEGRIQPVIGARLKLAEAEQAHQIQETGKLPDGTELIGKIVVQIGA
jgi:NADPH:quinone reductase